jgi:hypothetical protein
MEQKYDTRPCRNQVTVILIILGRKPSEATGFLLREMRIVDVRVPETLTTKPLSRLR